MTALKGRPKAAAKPRIVAVTSVAAYSSQKSLRTYTVMVQVRVDADSPAEAARLVQDVLLDEGGTDATAQ